MKVSTLLESFELIINTFDLSSIGLNRQVTFIILWNVLSEFLFYFYLGQSFFQMMKFVFHKIWKVLLDLFVCKKI